MFKNRGELSAVSPLSGVDLSELKTEPFSLAEADSLGGINQSTVVLVGVDKSESS